MPTGDVFMIGTVMTAMDTLEELGLTDPDAGFRPFAVVDRLGDGSSEGNGTAIVTWHWDGMEPGLADILYSLLAGNISAYVFIRTRLNRLNITATDYEWMTFGGWMRWSEGEENVPALHTLDTNIEFTMLTAYPLYPYP